MHFKECEFIHCNIYDVKLAHCSFKSCSFKNCTVMKTGFKYTIGGNNQFEDCVLMGINWAEFSKENKVFLPFTLLKRCTLKYNVFYGFKMKNFDLSDGDFSYSFFEECDLSGCKFNRVNLEKTMFTNNNLEGADFRDALNYGISIEANRLRGARFSFPDALNLLTAMGILIE